MSPETKQPEPAPEANEFEQLLEKVRAGCQSSARILYERHAQQVRMVVRHHLSKRARSFLDSEDVTQCVWRDLFAQAHQDTTFTEPDRFIAFLLGMAQNKALLAHRNSGAQKRDPARQQSLTAVHQATLMDRRPSPEQALSQQEELQKRIQTMPAEVRGAMLLLLRGASVAEVAAELRVSARTVYRLLEVARQ